MSDRMVLVPEGCGILIFPLSMTFPTEQRFSKDAGKTILVVEYDVAGATKITYAAMRDLLHAAGYETLSTTYPGELTD